MSDQQQLSKNQQKRLLKWEQRKANRPEWRKQQKEKKKQRKLLIQSLDPSINTPLQQPTTAAKVISNPNPKQYHILIDASYDHLMLDKEISSLASQIVRCYALNRRIQQPVNFTISSFGGKLEDKFKESHPDYQKFDLKFSSESFEHVDLLEKFVYLTADAEETLDELDQKKIYVIGGLVDRNRYKNATVEKARELGIKVAKLPLDQHIKLKSCQALTCNHVFEIMLQKINGKSWEESIRIVIPKRKIGE